MLLSRRKYPMLNRNNFVLMVRKIEELQAFMESEFGVASKQALLEIAKIARAMASDKKESRTFL